MSEKQQDPSLSLHLLKKPKVNQVCKQVCKFNKQRIKVWQRWPCRVYHTHEEPIHCRQRAPELIFMEMAATLPSFVLILLKQILTYSSENWVFFRRDQSRDAYLVPMPPLQLCNRQKVEHSCQRESTASTEVLARTQLFYRQKTITIHITMTCQKKMWHNSQVSYQKDLLSDQHFWVIGGSQ